MNSIRISGMFKFALGGLGFLVILTIFQALQSNDRSPTNMGFIVLGIPGAFGLSGLIELVSGVPFMQISEAWDELQGWQRGILGILVVIVACTVMTSSIIFFCLNF